MNRTKQYINNKIDIMECLSNPNCCNFDNLKLLRETAAFLAFEGFNLSGFDHLMESLNIFLSYPVQVSGTDRRHLTVTDSEEREISLVLSCGEISVITFCDNDDVFILHYSTNNFELISLDFYRNDNIFFIDFVTCEITMVLPNKRRLRVTNISRNKDLDFYLKVCSFLLGMNPTHLLNFDCIEYELNIFFDNDSPIIVCN